jgi:hypothetical protein
MISDYHHHIGIWPQFEHPLFLKVSCKDYSRENHQKNIIAYDGDRHIDRGHRPKLEGSRAIRGVRSNYLFNYANEMKSACNQLDPSQNSPENALRRLYK